MNQVIIPNSMFAIIKTGTEHNPEYLVGNTFEKFHMVPKFGIQVDNVIQMVVFFDYESADHYSNEIYQVHRIPTEVLNLVTGEVVK